MKRPRRVTARVAGCLLLLALVALSGYHLSSRRQRPVFFPASPRLVPHSQTQGLLQRGDFDGSDGSVARESSQRRYDAQGLRRGAQYEEINRIHQTGSTVPHTSVPHRASSRAGTTESVTLGESGEVNGVRNNGVMHSRTVAGDDKLESYGKYEDIHIAHNSKDPDEDISDGPGDLDYKLDKEHDDIESNPDERDTVYYASDPKSLITQKPSVGGPGRDAFSASPSRGSTLGACNTSTIESWKRGVVTELHPPITADCDLLRRNNRAEVERVKRDINSWKSSESEEEWRESLSNCSKVVRDFSNNFYNSPTEVDIPLAYVLVVYTNPRQMVRLIKTLWRPQNLFCIHPDAKQSEEFIGVFRQLAKCLDNVFLPRKLEKVYYQHHTIMDSQMNCYEDLMTFPPARWKYVINLCGRELPLKTNREMVESLRKLKGHSVIESQRVHTDSKGYLAMDRFRWKAEEDYSAGKLRYTQERLRKPPIPIYKSANFIAATRPFVNFFLTDKKAVEFRNYLRQVKIPEEEFYASLIHLPGVPGGLPPRGVALPTIDKYIWMNKRKETRSKYESCEGRMVHFICIVGVGDLDQIYHSGVNRRTPVFFFNKYFMEEDHVVMDCMEERLIQQNMKEHAADCSHKH